MSDSVHEAQGGKITIVGKWAFDIIYEFVYQFQEACQYREKAVRRHTRYGWPMNHHLPYILHASVRLLFVPNPIRWSSHILHDIHAHPRFSTHTVVGSRFVAGHVFPAARYRWVGVVNCCPRQMTLTALADGSVRGNFSGQPWFSRCWLEARP